MQKHLYADLYDLEDAHWWHIAKRKMCLALIKKYLKEKNAKILDIGCGTGKNLEEFNKFGQAFGIDNSPEAIKFCEDKRHLTNVTLGSAEKTGLKSLEFDLVSMLDVLEHTNDIKTLKEAARILKKDGLLLITVPAYQFMWSNWDVVLHHRRRYTKGQVEELLKKAGFEVLKSTYLYSFLLFPVFIVRKIKNVVSGKTYSSDFKLGLPILGRILGSIADLERFIALRFKIPFGLSIVVLAKKHEGDKS